MNNYRVVVKEVHAFPYRVEAASLKDAIDKALEGEGSQDINDLDNWESHLETLDILRVEVFNTKHGWVEVKK